MICPFSFRSQNCPAIANSSVVKHQTADLGTRVQCLVAAPHHPRVTKLGSMPNANMCSGKPLVPSDRFLLTDSDFDQTPKDLLTWAHTYQHRADCNNLMFKSELKLSSDVLEARHTDMKQSKA